MRRSQKQNIKAALEGALARNGRGITHLDALQWFGCARLAARIADLRGEGMDIRTTTVKEGRKTFARYSLRRK